MDTSMWSVTAMDVETNNASWLDSRNYTGWMPVYACCFGSILQVTYMVCLYLSVDSVDIAFDLQM